MKRCTWCNLNNPKYIEYHDHEWGKFNTNEKHLFEMLILESFQAGLSWERILNKREAFKVAYEDFDIDKVIKFDEAKIEQLRNNPKIIRNKLKIKASISNAKIFKSIQEEYQTFYNYLCTFTHGKIIYETNKTTSSLSDSISNDLKKRGMKFVGSTIIYSYLQAIGVIYSHEKDCFLYKD
ncbi:DNA-3-methyladenine glycosylase I [Holdemanella biformis]|uniref:DNA-3-methyladenine glycosylase I n=1 Tax=Holdemanella biformis TaxID=1735 RepID=UPI0026713E4F|nr:DNA-3-methyladenine glycosylase I [Holdemanella biformis]